jgi:ankyrin repeat protein
MARLGFDNLLMNMDKEKIDFKLKDYNNRTALHIAAGNNNV